jgi:hypothetical protein
MNRISAIAIFAIGVTSGWLAHPHPTLPALTAPFQYELPNYPDGAHWEHIQLDVVEWQMCQLGQKFYCSIQAGDDRFTAHLKAEGRWYH